MQSEYTNSIIKFAHVTPINRWDSRPECHPCVRLINLWIMRTWLVCVQVVLPGWHLYFNEIILLGISGNNFSSKICVLFSQFLSKKLKIFYEHRKFFLLQFFFCTNFVIPNSCRFFGRFTNFTLKWQHYAIGLGNGLSLKQLCELNLGFKLQART